MAMERTTVDGKTVNRRTADMLGLWQFNCLTDFYIVQGSYNSGVSQSAGTHDGGGAVDISEYGWSDAHTRKVIYEGRRCGFAAWHRPTISGLWNEHTHAIAIADPELSSGARAQVAEYYAGGDGLLGNTPDPGPRLRKIPVWPNVPKKKINLAIAWRQFRIKNPKPRTTVKRIQWVLNEKLGTNLVCDGVAGPQTRKAYQAWEKKIKSPKVDGVPGPSSLKQLGQGRFTVSLVAYEKALDAVQGKDKHKKHEKDNPTFPNK